jgi:hypothetical protein
MVINPIDNTVTDIKQFNYFSTTAPNTNIENLEKEIKQLAEKSGDVVAMAPKDHLRALQQDLIKRGYRKVR